MSQSAAAASPFHPLPRSASGGDVSQSAFSAGNTPPVTSPAISPHPRMAMHHQSKSASDPLSDLLGVGGGGVSGRKESAASFALPIGPEEAEMIRARYIFLSKKLFFWENCNITWLLFRQRRRVAVSFHSHEANSNDS